MKITIENPKALEEYSNKQPQQEQSLKWAWDGTDEAYEYELYSRGKRRGLVWVDRKVYGIEDGFDMDCVRIAMSLDKWTSSVYQFIPRGTANSVGYVYAQIVHMYRKYRAMDII